MIIDKVSNPKPKVGDTRSLLMYALFPTTVEHDGKEVIVIFEHYTEHQKYRVSDGKFSNMFYDTAASWVTTKKVLNPKH